MDTIQVPRELLESLLGFAVSHLHSLECRQNTTLNKAGKILIKEIVDQTEALLWPSI